MRLRTLLNVIFSWIGLATNMAVGFLLTPYILHRLGDTAMGLWFLLTTLTGYYGILDFGIRSAIIRYIARFDEQQDIENFSKVLSTGLVTYSAVAGVLLMLTLLVSWQVDAIFNIAPEWVDTARSLLLIVGSGTAVSLALGMFGGVLEGLHRFTWTSGVQTVAVLLRAGLIVFLLERGGGILTVGAVTVSLNVLAALVYVVLVFRLRPQVRLRPQFVEMATFKSLVTFGIVTFWVSIANNLRFYANETVIGIFLSVSLVTMFAVSSRLVRYSMDTVQAMAQVFTPMSSALDARNDRERLRKVFLLGNRYCALVMLPLAGILVISGKTILRVWVGEPYVASYPYLCWLIVPTALYMSQAASTKILYGMARHQTLARVLLAEGITNLLLSIALLKWWGLLGVAIGSALPLAATSLYFLPRHLCRLLNVSPVDFVCQAFSYPLLLNLPFWAVLYLIDRTMQATNWRELIISLGASGFVYALALLVFVARKENLALR
jgi:O-antigen/teichoic acid export membrane protein